MLATRGKIAEAVCVSNGWIGLFIAGSSSLMPAFKSELCSPPTAISPCRQNAPKAWAREGSPAGGQVCSSPGLRATTPLLFTPLQRAVPADYFPVPKGNPSPAPAVKDSDTRRVQGRAESPCCARRHTPRSRAASAKKESPRVAPPEGCRGERKAPAVPAGTPPLPRARKNKLCNAFPESRKNTSSPYPARFDKRYES